MLMLKEVWSPLQMATGNEELGIIKYLLDKGAGIDTKINMVALLCMRLLIAGN